MYFITFVLCESPLLGMSEVLTGNESFIEYDEFHS